MLEKIMNLVSSASQQVRHELMGKYSPDPDTVAISKVIDMLKEKNPEDYQKVIESLWGKKEDKPDMKWLEDWIKDDAPDWMAIKVMKFS